MQPEIFDTELVQKHYARAASGFKHYDVLWKEMVARINERLDEITRPFPSTLLLSPIPADVPHSYFYNNAEIINAADESLDAILSINSLHWVNDVVGALIQMRNALKPDGLLLATFPGGETLKELRASLAHAETELTGGMSPRIAPFIDVRDGGNVLQRAGFVEPVADTETITLTYANIFELMHDLRGMGQTNPLRGRRSSFTPMELFILAEEYYREHFTDNEGRLKMTVDLITLTGWKPNSPQGPTRTERLLGA
ncbi:MAG: methyltransferase domain-containing protein [Alphaproteobacteria bacterium]|nr:methyltransferase domain-containing protein [Alphaproteobacteria bacterium]